MDDAEKQQLEFNRLVFSQLRQSLLQDAVASRKEKFVGRKYSIENLATFMENPDTDSNQKLLRQMSLYLYLVSTHYRRLVNYFATLPTFNYYVSPDKATVKPISMQKYKAAYFEVITEMERYNFKDELPKAIVLALLQGAFCGIPFESEDTFYIRPCPIDQIKITSIMDGCFRFSLNLTYFDGANNFLLDAYGDEIRRAYETYKNSKNKKDVQWYEPTKQICIKFDSDATVILPFFCGMYKEVLDLEDYRTLAKAKTEIENYKVLVMQQDVNEDGRPKMDFELAEKYYRQAAGNLPSGIGLILSPFKVTDFAFNKSNVAEANSVNDARDSLWESAGTSPLIFGSTKATSSASLILSTKPDEELSFLLLRQLERNFNLLQKQKNRKFSFKLKFLEQSVYSREAVQDSFFKAAQYGVTGAKTLYAASLGLSPCDIVNMAYLEDKVLELGAGSFNTPLTSSNTMSHTDSEAGRPSNASQNKPVSESRERGLEQE